MTEILDWNNIQNTYKNSTILIDNGASIAVSDKFRYDNIFNLIEKIQNIEIKEKLEKLFNKFESHDFELILRKLSHAEDINEILNIKDKGEIIKYKRGIKGVLIQAIIEIHPPYSDAEDKLKSLYFFIKHFKRIISLNYDLLIYWAVMEGKDIQDCYEIKDCFTNQGPVSGTLELRHNSLQHLNNNTFVCYLHGNIALAYDQNKTTVKIIKTENNLLDTIKAFCKKNKTYTPLFVSEGTGEQKKQAIKRSPYLSTIFDEVLQNLPNNRLTIYGFSFSEQDLYILEQIAKTNNIENVAVSVYKDGNEEFYCSKVKEILKKKLNISDNNIQFFDSATVGDWSKKIDETSDTTTYQQLAPTSQEYENFPSLV